MGRRNKTYSKDLHQQAYERLVGMQAFGESKREAIKDGTDKDKIFSFNTYQSYWKHTKYFLKYVREHHPDCTTLKKARRYVKEEDSGYTVIFPDLNFLATQGSDLQQAVEKAVECLAGYIHTCQMDGDNVPAPSAMDEIDPKAVFFELDPDEPVGEAFVNLVTVDVEEYAKTHFEKSARKNLTISTWLGSVNPDEGTCGLISLKAPTCW